MALVDKKIWKMRLTVKPIVVVVHGTDLKDLKKKTLKELDISGNIKTI